MWNAVERGVIGHMGNDGIKGFDDHLENDDLLGVMAIRGMSFFCYTLYADAQDSDLYVDDHACHTYLAYSTVMFNR